MAATDTLRKPRKHAGIGFRAKSQAVFIDMGAAFKGAAAAEMKETTPDEQQLSVLPWSPWGANNLLPQQYVRDIQTCGVLNAIIEGKSRFALAQGLKPAIVHVDPATGEQKIDRYVDDPEVLDFLEENNHFEHTHAWLRDLVAFGWANCRYMLNNEGSAITGFQRNDVSECRFSKKDKKLKRSTQMWYSGSWDRVFSPNDQRVFSIPLLKEQGTLAHLEEGVAAGVREFDFVYRAPGWGVHYYPVPLWMAAYKWVKIAQSVPEMKASLFENSMRPKYKVIIMENYWEDRFGGDWDEEDEDKCEEMRQQVFDEIDNWLVGSKNAHKSIFVEGKLVDDSGKVITNVDIIPIDDNTKPGELLPDSAAANSEIAIAMLWNNTIQGGNQKDGQYANNEGGSMVREATLVQTILHEVERGVVRRFMNPIKVKNGWQKRLCKDGQRLEFMINANILTTLDTGGGFKQVNTSGVSSQNKPKDNGADKEHK